MHKSIAGKKNDFKDEQQETDLKNYGKIVHVELDNPQSTILIALPGISRASDKKFAVRLANLVFGGCGFSSRLLKRLRDVDGLVYRIHTAIVDKDLQSYVNVSAKTRPENTANAIKAIKEECKTLLEKGVNQNELDAVKTYVYATGDLVSNADKVQFVSRCRTDNVPLEDVNGYLGGFFNPTLDDVNTALKEVFDPEKMVIAGCGKSGREEVPIKPNDKKKINEEEKK
jgi:zinc protease